MLVHAESRPSEVASQMVIDVHYIVQNSSESSSNVEVTILVRVDLTKIWVHASK